MSELAQPLLAPLALALGAGGATWLGVSGACRRVRATRERRAHRLALITGRVAPATSPTRPRVTAGDAAIGRHIAPTRGATESATRALKRALPLVLAAVCAGMAGAALAGPLAALLLAVTMPPLVLVVGARRRAARRGRLNGQLPDLLQAVAGALVAGQSFLQALDQAAREIGEPLRSELQTVLGEIELGVSLEQALEHLRARTFDHDLALVIDAVLIQRRVGGNLAEVLTNIALTVRERIRIRGEVRALTGQARLSSWVLSALPLALGLGLVLLNHDYMRPLIETGLGRALLVCALGSEFIGMLFMRRIANVRV